MLLVNQFSGFASLGRRVLSSLTQIGSATAATSAITLPSGIQQGDLIILLDFATSGSVPTAVTPTGFTNLQNVSDGSVRRFMVSYKIADGTESSTSVTGMNGSSQNRKGVLTFRGNTFPVSATGAGGTQETSLNAPATQNQNVSGFTTPLIILAMYASNGSVTTRGFSTTKDGEISQVSNQWYLAWKTYNASPANTALTQSDDGTNTLFSCYVQVT